MSKEWQSKSLKAMTGEHVQDVTQLMIKEKLSLEDNSSLGYLFIYLRAVLKFKKKERKEVQSTFNSQYIKKINLNRLCS